MPMPGINYPPASIASWCKECTAKGRDDLAKLVMGQWNKAYGKYPACGQSWGAATKIGMASVKKNIFGGMEFATWLSSMTGRKPLKIAA